ncbi:MAG: DUF4286 family protein [Bdellovibrionaceae bacterium]|nr:DUF4286 family protein [Bdellovibrionales bacterium]MCB9086592.1 DUF4286 family protein [Pseudobdellovibrionaceae bacterium]
MIIYEVNLTVVQTRSEEFVAWLNDHIGEMLQFPGFRSAKLCHVKVGPEVKTNSQSYTVHYLIQDQAALDSYLETHAARMRSEGIKLFGGDFSASRRVLSQLLFLPD